MDSETVLRTDLELVCDPVPEPDPEPEPLPEPETIPVPLAVLFNSPISSHITFPEINIAPPPVEISAHLEPRKRPLAKKMIFF